MTVKNWFLAGTAILPLLGACGKSKSAEPASASDIKGDDIEKRTVFNFADFIKESSTTSVLIPYAKTGEIVLGDLKKIGIRTNILVDTSGNSSITAMGNRNIVGQYYLNGAVYPDGVAFRDRVVKIPNSQPEYSIIDIEAKAGFDVQGVEGHVRLFGDDKLSFSEKSAYEQSFTRELSVAYPVMIGLSSEAKIGGEIGFNTQVNVRADDAISLSFMPNVSIHSSIGAKADVLKLLSAEIKGVLTFIETAVKTTASVSYLRDQDFSFGDINMSSNSIKALDGKVVVVAKAGLDELLPDSFDEIWKSISDATGISLGYTWEHTVWDPEPLAVGKTPARGTIFASSMSSMTQDDCASIDEKLVAKFQTMVAKRDASDGEEASEALSASASLSKTLESARASCGKF